MHRQFGNLAIAVVQKEAGIIEPNKQGRGRKLSQTQGDMSRPIAEPGGFDQDS
jgi:hypothetical protein